MAPATSGTYAIRVTPREDTDDEQKVGQILDKIGGAHVGCREYATNEHIHIVLWTDWDIKKVRNLFSNTLGKLGNGALSIKKAEDDKGAMRYCCKGDNQHPEPKGNPPDVIWHYGHTAYPTPMDAHEAYWQTSKEIKSTKGLTFTTQVEHYMKANNMEITLENACDAVVELAIQKKNVLNEFHLATVAKMVVAKNCRRYKKEKQLSVYAIATRT